MTYTRKYLEYQKNIGSNSYNSKYVKIIRVIQPLFAKKIYSLIGIKGNAFFGKIYRFLKYLISFFKTNGVSADIIIYAYKR